MNKKNTSEPNFKHRFKSLLFWTVLLVIYSVLVTAILVILNNELQSKKAELTNLQLTYEILLEKSKE